MRKIKYILRKSLGFFVASILLMVYDENRRLKKILTSYDVIPLYSHNINEKKFRKLYIWLNKNNVDFISTKDLLEIFLDKKKTTGKVWFSLDDGWRENYRLLGTITKYRIPITIFLSTNCIEKGYFWFSHYNRSKNLFKKLGIVDIWELPEAERRNISPMFDFIARGHQRETLSIEEIKKMNASGFIEFGNHTDNHVVVNNCNEGELFYEVNNANRKIKQWIGADSSTFAYPKGMCRRDIQTVLIENKIKLAATTNPGYISSSKDEIYFLNRISLNDNFSFKEIRCRVLGIWPTLKIRI